MFSVNFMLCHTSVHRFKNLTLEELFQIDFSRISLSLDYVHRLFYDYNTNYLLLHQDLTQMHGDCGSSLHTYHHSFTDQLRPLPLLSAVNNAKQLSVQFIDTVEIISCDALGCDYYNPRYSVGLRTSEGAILSSGGIYLACGTYMFADGVSVRRVS